MDKVTAKDIGDRLRLTFDAQDKARVDLLIADAAELVGDEFARAGRDLEREVAAAPWLGNAVRRAIREMVAAAITVGGNAGMRSVSSTTGPQADAVTYTDSALLSVSFGGVRLTDGQKADLGLAGVVPRFRFPRVSRWPERR
ncbi:Gp19/Gp15/Gp42 family protein [Dietzia maris]